MGCVSKMSVLKVLRVVGEVSGSSGTVGFWSPMHSRQARFWRLENFVSRFCESFRLGGGLEVVKND